jgi:hypothetical protein
VARRLAGAAARGRRFQACWRGWVARAKGKRARRHEARRDELLAKQAFAARRIQQHWRAQRIRAAAQLAEVSEGETAGTKKRRRKQKKKKKVHYLERRRQAIDNDDEVLEQAAREVAIQLEAARKELLNDLTAMIKNGPSSCPRGHLLEVVIIGERADKRFTRCDHCEGTVASGEFVVACTAWPRCGPPCCLFCASALARDQAGGDGGKHVGINRQAYERDERTTTASSEGKEDPQKKMTVSSASTEERPVNTDEEKKEMKSSSRASSEGKDGPQKKTTTSSASTEGRPANTDEEKKQKKTTARASSEGKEDAPEKPTRPTARSEGSPENREALHAREGQVHHHAHQPQSNGRPAKEEPPHVGEL